eukprot:11195022-Lingulodinium_polyedra.AAC.1
MGPPQQKPEGEADARLSPRPTLDVTPPSIWATSWPLLAWRQSPRRQAVECTCLQPCRGPSTEVGRPGPAVLVRRRP